MFASVNLAERLLETLDAYQTIAILSSCYEGVMLSHLSGKISEADQENNAQCRESIRGQLELIDRYTARPPSRRS